MTLNEIANNLGYSKSTVSRALSGKGRVGKDTRLKIQEYAKEHGVISENELSTTQEPHNLGVVFYDDASTSGSPYFWECLLGICESADLFHYNVFLTVTQEQNIQGVRSLVEQRGVDGIILTRSLEEDRILSYLRSNKIPVGMTGSCQYDDVIQVDIDNDMSSETLTSLLISRGFRHFALLVEDMNYSVNRSRYVGFFRAIVQNGLQERSQEVFTGKFGKERIESIAKEMVNKKVDCVICGDDILCLRMISQLLADGYRIPRDIAIASMYNSSTLNNLVPPVTAASASPRAMGNAVAEKMIQYLQGQEISKRTYVDYEILMRKSTERQKR